MTAPASALLRDIRPALEAVIKDDPSIVVKLVYGPLIDRIDAHLAAGSGEGWVACSERLPDEETWVMTWFDSADMKECGYTEMPYQTYYDNFKI